MVCRSGWKSRLWLFPFMILPPLVKGQSLPSPNLNLENLPDTSFSCEGKVVGGYYADIETKCQMFHVCTLGSKGETQDIKFLCLQGTVFDQETRVCERSEEVACKDAVEYYDLNKELYQPNSKPQSAPAETVADSDGEASVASVLFKVDSDSSRLGFPSGGYSDSASAFSDGGRTRRPTRTRADVPLFSIPRTEPRTSPPPAASQQAFSRFRQDRQVTAPSATVRPPAAAVSVPLIPSSNDLDRPRVVVTNGKPFVPKLSAPDPAPAQRPSKENFPSLTLPETNFTCESKVSGGHYADPETDCRMFHICVTGPDETITDYKFLCGSGTAFEQKSRTCQEIQKIDCSSSTKNYHVNDHLIVPKTSTETTSSYKPSKTESALDYAEYYDYYDYPEYSDYADPSPTDSQLSRSGSATYRSTV